MTVYFGAWITRHCSFRELLVQQRLKRTSSMADIVWTGIITFDERRLLAEEAGSIEANRYARTNGTGQESQSVEKSCCD